MAILTSREDELEIRVAVLDFANKRLREENATLRVERTDAVTRCADYTKAIASRDKEIHVLRAELARAQELIEKYKVVARWAEDAADCVDADNIRQGILKALAALEKKGE